ncbi:MAG TPA: prephenate dehydratase [Solirubrobacterales bacterium]|nr:prephenate dehydratase [Solirubrobacterales bacterium]
MKVAYLGPAGTFSEDALHAAAGSRQVDGIPAPTVLGAIEAVAGGDVDLALVPFENSTDGSVRATLDALAFDAPEVAIVGEHDEPIHHSLLARRPLDLADVTEVLSHPQPLAQCARFIREELTAARVRATTSTAEAAREVAESEEPWVAIASETAAGLYGCTVVRDGVEDSPDNVTRFIWVAAAGVEPKGDGRWKTSLWFSELGADHPGALVDALTEFSRRAVNLTRIESRPLRRQLGRYGFFVDLEGALTEEAVREAIAGLRRKAENVRVLGSYPVEVSGLPATQ